MAAENENELILPHWYDGSGQFSPICVLYTVTVIYQYTRSQAVTQKGLVLTELIFCSEVHCTPTLCNG